MAHNADELHEQIEAMTGMPYDTAKAFIDAMYRSEVDDTVDGLKAFLIEGGHATQDELNADMFEATEHMRSLFAVRDTGGDYEKQKAVMLIIDQYYLGHLVHKYRSAFFEEA